MTFRTLRIITVTVLSHLLLAAPAFTSELPLLPDAPSGAPASQEVTIEARQQSRQGDVYSLDGDVEVRFRNYVLRAGHASYDESTGEIEATGGVVFEGGPNNAHLSASRVTYNVKTETGNFYQVAGSFGAVVKGRSVVLTTSNPFVIAGAEVQKVGPNRYIVHHGSITSCAEPSPKWTLQSSRIDVVPGEDAKFYHSSFRLRRIPLFYLPYGQLPAVADARFSGFLLPAAGQSSTKGFILGQSVYWAINRSNDITLGAEFYSRRGWSQRMHFRSRPSANSFIDLRYFGVLDRGAPDTGQNQGGEEVWLSGETRQDAWHASASIDYLDSFLFRQAFSDSYSQAVNSEVRSVVFLSHNRGGVSLNASAERYQNFFENQLAPGQYDQTKILHLPTAEANVLEHRLGATPLRWSLDAVAGGLHRSDPGFVTADLVGRFDVRPVLALPIYAGGWRLRPEVALHDTFYTQRLVPGAGGALGVPIDETVNRQALETAVELRPPVLQKVFRREVLGRRLKHVIEPVFTYRYDAGVDNFQNIIRFDYVDILSDTSEFEYELTQRFYGRRRATNHDGGCDEYQQAPSEGPSEVLPPSYIPGMSALPPRCEDEDDVSRELVRWQVRQKYYLKRGFGGALVPGTRNVLTTTAALSGIAFLDGPRAWSPVVSKLRIQTSANTDVQWQLDYDPVRGKILSSATFLEYRLRDYFVGVSHSFFRELPSTTAGSTAPQEFDQVRYLVGYGHPSKRGFSGGFSMGHDVSRDFLQYVAAQSSYNWDCCGVSFEYRRLDVPGVNEENQYRFAFSLANIGTFGNLRRNERLY